MPAEIPDEYKYNSPFFLKEDNTLMDGQSIGEICNDHVAEYVSIFKTVYQTVFLEAKCSDCSLQAAMEAVVAFQEFLED